jgi:hypothetical protein
VLEVELVVSHSGTATYRFIKVSSLLTSMTEDTFGFANIIGMGLSTVLGSMSVRIFGGVQNSEIFGGVGVQCCTCAK